jgi:hypothetical protein
VVAAVSTQLFFRDTNTVIDWSRGSGSESNLSGGTGVWQALALATSRGAVANTLQATSVTGATTGLEATVGGIFAEWISDPLDRDTTIAGTITVNVWGSESSMNANAALGCIVERLDSQGARVSTIAQGIAAAELGTTAAVQNFTLTPTSTAMLKGERFRIRVYFDDAPATTMGAGFTLVFRCAGPTAAADGDSYITFTEDFGFMAGPSTLVSQTSGVGNNIVFGTTNAITAGAQSFQLTAGASIGSVTVRLSNFGASNPSGDFRAEIRTDNAGVPSSTVLGSGTMPNASYASAAFNTITLTTPTGVLSASTTYWLVLSEVGGGANYTTWARAASNIYAGGAPKRFESGAWVDNPTNPTFDYVFTIISQDYTTPLGSVLYLTNAASAVDPNGATHDAKEAWTSRGSGSTTGVTGDEPGPLAPLLARVSAAGNFLEWFTRPITAFTLSGLAKVDVWAKQQTTAIQACLRAEIAICATDGTSPVVWGAANDGIALEAVAAGSAHSFLIAGDDTAVTDGQRLRIRIYFDDAPAANMSNQSASLTLYYAGTSAGAAGDTYVTLPQTVTEFSSGTPVSASDSATASDVVTGTAHETTDSGAGSDVSDLARPVTDTATAADVAVVSVPISVTDSATSADTSDKGMTVTDSGSGADTAPTLAKTVTDVAVGVDAWVNTAQAAVDSGTGADASAVSVPVAAADTGAGADASALTAAIPVTDIGAGADSIPTLAKAVIDAATAADTSSVTTGNQVNVTEAGSVIDVSALTAVLVASETAAVADTAVVSTGTTASITSPLPQLAQALVASTTIQAVQDSFNRADGAIGTADTGQAWIAQSGTWNISTNRVYRASSEMQSTVVIDSGFTTCSLSVDATFPSGLQDSGLVFADIDDNNYLLLVFETSPGPLYELRLWKRDGGSFTLLSGPHTVPNYSNTTKRVRVEWDATTGDIELWFGGTQVEVLTLGSGDLAKYSTGTRQGLRENAVPAGDKTFFDNYSVVEELLPTADVSNVLPTLSNLTMVRHANTTGWSDPASDTTPAGAGTQVIVVTAGV